MDNFLEKNKLGCKLHIITSTFPPKLPTNDTLIELRATRWNEPAIIKMSNRTAPRESLSYFDKTISSNLSELFIVLNTGEVDELPAW